MRAHEIMTRQVITIGAELPSSKPPTSCCGTTSAACRWWPKAGWSASFRKATSSAARRPEPNASAAAGCSYWVGPGRIASDFVHGRGRKVGEIMTPEPVTLVEDTPLQETVQIMEKHHVKRLPVLRGDRLVGIVTRSDILHAVADIARDIPDPSADDDQLRASIVAAVEQADWSPCRFNVTVRDGIARLSGIVTDERCRQAAIVAAENVPGVRQVHDHLALYPPPEEDLGGGDFVSLQSQPSTVDDEPL